MNSLILTAVLALLGTGLAYAAGVWGGLFGGILLVAATIFNMLAYWVVGSEAYNKDVTDAQAEDVYE